VLNLLVCQFFPNPPPTMLSGAELEEYSKELIQSEYCVTVSVLRGDIMIPKRLNETRLHESIISMLPYKELITVSNNNNYMNNMLHCLLQYKR